MNLFTNLFSESSLGLAGVLATITSLIVQVLKNVLPKKVPTKIVAMITSFLVMFSYLYATGTLTVANIPSGIFGGFVISFISMFGFDQFKETVKRLGGEDK